MVVRQSLRRILLTRLWAPLLILMLVGALLSLSSARYFANLVYDQWLYDSAMTLASQIKGNGADSTLALPASAIEMLEWDRIDRVFYEVTTNHHGRIFGNAFLPHPPATNKERAIYYDGAIGPLAVRLSAVKLNIPSSGDDVATVVVAETLAKRNAVVRNIMIAIIPIEACLVLLAGLIIWIAVISTLRGVDQLAADLALVRPDRLKRLESIEGVPLEIAPLVEALNGLIERVADARVTLERFVANAAHQLRTPLAALQLQTQRALREADPVRRQEALTAVDKGMRRLTHLTQQLLTLARAEPTGAHAGELERPVDLAAIACEEVEHWIDAAISMGIDLGYEGETSGVFVHGDRQLLAELIGNLVDNAIQYGKGGGRATVRISTAPTTLSVEDDGPGIPPAERARVLERFYRLPASVGSGSGLGLAIAHEIAARHGAQLEVESGRGGVGTLVSVTFAL